MLSQAALIERLIQIALPRARVLETTLLEGGLRNTNYKVRTTTDDTGVWVLRIYEHEPSLCRKEIALHQLVRKSVAVPEIVHAEPDGVAMPDDDDGTHDKKKPFILMRYVAGRPFHELLEKRDETAIAEASASAGAMLAAIGRFTFDKVGWLERASCDDAGDIANATGDAEPRAALRVTTPLLEGADPCPRFVDECLASIDLKRRLSAHRSEELLDRAHEVMWSWAPRLASLDDERRLVHCDFGSRNILVSSGGGGWGVAAVLDWEFAISASPLIDVGHFLRYPQRHRRTLVVANAPALRSAARVEPSFSEAFVDHGGVLPPDWRPLSRIMDLTALCELLTHASLPDDLTREVIDLVRATLDDPDVRRA